MNGDGSGGGVLADAIDFTGRANVLASGASAAYTGNFSSPAALQRSLNQTAAYGENAAYASSAITGKGGRLVRRRVQRHHPDRGQRVRRQRTNGIHGRRP